MTTRKENDGKMFCPNCGKEMSFQVRGSSAEWACPNHGVMLTTTYAVEEEMDSSIYFVLITKQSVSADKIKLLSKLSSKNYIECKNVLNSGGKLLEEEGWKLRPILKQLKEAGIQFTTTPVFPYSLK